MGGSEAECSPKSTFSFLAGVVMGTVNTLIMKIMYETHSVGVDGVEKGFEKPLFLTLVMFAAMFLSLPSYYIWNNFFAKEKDPPIPFKVLVLLAIPSGFDLVGTAVSQVGLLYVTPSLFMLVRCFVIIVTALLKVFVLKHKLAIHSWLGVMINFGAMIIVSAPSFLTPSAVNTNGRDPRIGILFIMLSCLVQGSQYVFEEKVMAVDGAPPLVVVGMEGFWGSLMSILICWPLFYSLPGNDAGSLENMWDAVVMLRNNHTLILLCVVFFVSVALYNVFAVFITHLLSSIWHAILDNFRPVAVWATDLMLFYIFTHGRFGEALVWPGSALQFVGMLVLFFGTAVYNGSVPALLWPDAAKVEREEDGEDLEGGAKTTLMHTPRTMQSQNLTMSPLVSGGRRRPGQGSPAVGRANYGSINQGHGRRKASE